MKKIFYEKVGRRYKPMAEYDDEVFDSFPSGSHLVICKPGSTSRKYNIDPALAPMIAAGTIAEESMSSALMVAAKLRPSQTPLTPGQLKAWQKLEKEFDCCTLSYPSASDIAQAGVKAMIVEAEKLMTHAAVREAYDHFMLICKLTQNHTPE